MTRLMTALILVLVLTGTVAAQHSDQASVSDAALRAQSGIGISPAVTPFSLIDLSRINWSHSYSVAFFSGGGTSGSVGVWNTSLDYDISSNLHLALNLGVLHNPGSLWNGNDSKADFLPGFRLDWRPSDNFFMSVSYQDLGGYYSPYDRGFWR